MGTILFVCTGNTCRSPMAEAFARSLHPRFKGTFASAGISASGGASSEMAARVMSEAYGLDIEKHISRQLSEEDVANVSLILTMTVSHLRYVKNLFPKAAGKAFTLKGFAFKDDEGDISDPFLGDWDVYAACAEEIRRCVEAMETGSI